MRIKQIVIEGVGGEVEIRRTERGAVVSANDVEVEVGRDDSGNERYAAAHGAAAVVYGERRGRPNCSNSEVHEVLDLVERVAGC